MRQEVATDSKAPWTRIREASRARAPDSPVPGEHRDMRTARPDEEHELDSRLRDRDRTIEDLSLRLRELTGLLHKEQATRESQAQRITTLETQLLARRRPQRREARARTPPKSKGKMKTRRAGSLRKTAKPKTRKRRKR